MASSFWKFFFVFAILLAPRPMAAVQPLSPTEDRSLPVHRPLRSSGLIFSGTVKAIERIVPKNTDSVAVMSITFQVEQGFRGVRAGQTVVIREWAGLWQTGDRYRVGQRFFLFLYPPSKLGLTSPVGGDSGRLLVDPGGRVVVPPKRHLPGTTKWRPGGERFTPGELIRAMQRAEVE